MIIAQMSYTRSKAFIIQIHHALTRSLLKFASAAAVAFEDTILKSFVTPLDLRDE
jgi:hypothetical protein